jgi:hypothetical protein
MKKFWLLQFAANLALILGFYEWLGIRDSRISQLILSTVLGLALIAGTVFLHSRTFHLPPVRFAIVLAIFLLICWGMGAIPLDKFGLWIASSLTYRLRKPVRPDLIQRILDYLRIFVQWIVVPLLLLGRRSPKFWLEYVLILLGAFWVPSWLIHWTPKLTATALQVASFILRFGIAYCLVVTGFTALWLFTSPGKPVESQPSTVPVP